MKMEILRSKYIFPVIILLGIVVSVIINKSAPPMVHEEKRREAVPVTYIEAKVFNVNPAITGFGEVEPEVLLNATAEVSGRITELSPKLKKGHMLPAGTAVLEIDQKDYLLSLKQAKADLAKSEASLKELELKTEDIREELTLAEDRLSLGTTELKRVEQLMKKSSASRSSYDNQRSNVLKLKQEVQILKNQLNILPAQIDVQKAQVDISKANIQTQQHNLDRTNLVLPFNARVIEVNVEKGEFVNQGSPLFSVQAINKVLIEAHFTLDQFRLLAKGFPTPNVSLKQAFLNGDSEALFSSLGLKAKVYLNNDSEPVWNAKFERITGSLDPSARTLGVVVSVENPYRNVEPGIKPPLVKGMYMEVRLEGRSQPFYVVPRDALHNGELYLITHENTLERVTLEYQEQGSMLLIEDTLSEGMRIVTSDLFPAVPGMSLQPTLDKSQSDVIDAWVTGTAK